MKTKIVLIAGMAIATHAFAGTVYDSGTATGTNGDGWGNSANGQTAIADFSLSSATNVQSFTMTMLADFGGNVATSTDVQWAIYSRTGTVVSALMGSGSAFGLTSSNVVVTGNLFNVYDVTVNVGGLNLAAGDYYLSTARDDDTFFAFWAFTGAPDGDTFALNNTNGVLGQAGNLPDPFINNVDTFDAVDYAFTIDGNTVNVVPLPPAAFAGLGILGCMGAYQRIRR
jgi:hypothetical protein